MPSHDVLSQFDVIVMGLGAMGSAACFHLARRGASVLGLEQFSIPHTMGSSHGDSRLIRLCYYEHPHYVPLLKRAYQLWDELETIARTRVLFRTGGVYIGSPGCEFIAGAATAARDHGLAHELLDRDQLAQRFPQFAVPDDHVGFFEPTAGFLLPERAIAAHSGLAMMHGAELHGCEPVIDWNAESNRVIVRTQHTTYTAKRLLICGGAWSERLVKNLGVPLVITRQVLGWVWPKRPERFALGALPVWAIDNGDNTQHYGFPLLPAEVSSRPGFKIAHHFRGTPVTADTISRTPAPEDEHDFRSALRQLVPEADGPLLSMTVCMYTNSPDSHFIIDRHPTMPGVTFACGFSGHGFKFASVIGEALADLTLNGGTNLPVGFLGLERLRPALR